MTGISEIQTKLKACVLCRDRFLETVTEHEPRPIVWFSETASVVIAGQAPGARVHASGRPFDDRSGDRLRDWMAVSRDLFYDRSQISIIPMGFCFPGYDKNGSDIPPPKLCRDTWHGQIFDQLPAPKVRLIVGGFAQKYHLKTGFGVTETVQNWREFGDGVFPLPHPSWRNTGWLRKNPWFEAELLPELRQKLSECLNEPTCEN